MTTTQEYGLGGFLKSIAPIALPLIGNALLPGVGGIVGSVVGGVIAGSGSDAPAENGRATAQRLLRSGPAPTRGNIKLEKGGFVPTGKRPTQFVGPTHAAGGIRLPGGAEVEGGETMDYLKGGLSRKGVPYIFSNKTVPGSTMTFSATHKAMVSRGGSEVDVRQLADLQEQVMGRRSGAKEGEYNLGGVAKELLPYVPAAINMIMGATAKGPKVARPTFMGSDHLRPLQNLSTDVSVEPELASQRQTLGTAASSNLTSAQKLVALAGNLRESGATFGRQRQEEANLRRQKAAMLTRERGKVAQTNTDVANEYSVRKAAAENQMTSDRRTTFGAGISQASSIFQQQQADKRREKMIPIELMAATMGLEPAIQKKIMDAFTAGN